MNLSEVKNLLIEVYEILEQRIKHQTILKKHWGELYKNTILNPNPDTKTYKQLYDEHTHKLEELIIVRQKLDEME